MIEIELCKGGEDILNQLVSFLSFCVLIVPPDFIRAEEISHSHFANFLDSIFL